VERDDLLVYAERAGDFRVPFSAITDVHLEKVILNCGGGTVSNKDRLSARLNARTD
jgi:hypothetical protein